MIRTWISLVPADRRGQGLAYAVLTFVSVVLRAVGTVLLVPLVGALFSDAPQRALAWLGWLTAATVLGWVIDTTTARIGFDLGFAVLDHTQHDVADRLPEVRLDWFTAENTATARQAIASTGPELVGLVVNLLTPLIGASAAARGHRAGPAAGLLAARRSPRWPACRCCSARCGPRCGYRAAPTPPPVRPTPR